MPSRTESCHGARSRGRRPGRRRAGCRREPRGRTWLRRTTQPVASTGPLRPHARDAPVARGAAAVRADALPLDHVAETLEDRKSTRLNSSHITISYAVFCLKKKKKNNAIKSDTINVNDMSVTSA